MVLLQFAVVRRQTRERLDFLIRKEEFNVYDFNLLFMMQKVMRQIIGNITKNATTVHSNSSIPIVEKYEMGEVPEGGGEDDEEGRWHHESVTVHGKVVVDAM